MVKVIRSSRHPSRVVSRDSGDEHSSNSGSSSNSQGNSGSSSTSSSQGSSSSGSNSQGKGSNNDSDDDDSDDDCDKSENSSNKQQNCFFCINDNDPRVHYDSGWKLSQTNQCAETTHSTTRSGSVASLSFNGSGIVVFGIVPESNTTNPPPTTVYTLDTSLPYVTTEPRASKDVSMQPLFAASQLSDDEHTLVINVTNVTGAPFTLEYFFIFPKSNLSQDAVGSSPAFPAPSVIGAGSSNSSLASPSTSPLHGSDVVNVLKIMTALLGSFVVLLTFLVGFLLFRLKRRSKTQPYLNPSPPISSKRSNTIFTSTESIERNHPAAMWSDYSRSSRTGTSYVSSDPVPVSIVASPKGSSPSEKSNT